MAIEFGEGSGVRVYYQAWKKRGRMLKKSWLDQTLLLMGFSNTGQPLFKHANDAGVGLHRENSHFTFTERLEIERDPKSDETVCS